jgi:hypothetical protein
MAMTLRLDDQETEALLERLGLIDDAVGETDN